MERFSLLPFFLFKNPLAQKKGWPNIQRFTLKQFEYKAAYIKQKLGLMTCNQNLAVDKGSMVNNEILIVTDNERKGKCKREKAGRYSIMTYVCICGFV